MNKQRLLCILLLLSLLPLACRKNDESSDRTFYMGVTPWPPDFTSMGKALAYGFVQEHCDMISHHFDDGVPYEECLYGRPMPKALTDDVNERLSRTPSGKKILLSVAPLLISRKEKAAYRSDTANAARDAAWAAKAMNDSTVITAYTHYMEYLVDHFHPDYVNYAVECNSGDWDESRFGEFRVFCDSVYHRLKREYPSTPFFVSFMAIGDDAFYNHARALEPFSDYIALSTYPYTLFGSPAGGTANPRLIPDGFYERYIDINAAKPFAIAENGFIARDLVMNGIHKLATPLDQEDYMNYILKLCEKHHAVFVIWFCAYDYNAADNTLQAYGVYTELFGLWESTGLLDQNRTPRPALQVWDKWRKKEKVN